ncbi:dihydrofolate reductase [Nonomuraea sp. NN258]|uniref:dihydrofolate reductase family protein n=1 Tax=Nonomuraea antri TaxID=2730852 RepID=UPI00156983DF|nr:dihydrofolate reductase family protein [Nonomuraea antri]NRQ38560.1 dihydrofolate reductase [Nonomuraea antri]
MRKVKLQLQITADGFVGGPDGEMDWAGATPWTGDLNAHVEKLWERVDCIVLGRVLAEGFIPAWESRPEGETEEGIDKMIDTPKVVVSRSLTESPWKNAVVAGGDLTETINELKAAPGGDVMVAGGATLGRELISRGLIDELHLFVNPIAIGAGLSLFPAGAGHQRLRLVAARPFDCGVVGLHYEPLR